jgi:ferredoxin, 2Fe-2S
MALVARARRSDYCLGGQGTLLAQCLEAGLPVASACSGRGACGKCVISVLQGAESLESPDSHEREVLVRNGAAPNQRLSCRCEAAAGADLIITTGYW